MYHPTTRVLAALELLQAHGRMTGAELARRLEVDVRTARRYIEMLQDLGIPIEGERGRYGAYRLRPGYKLPPMMFTEDEALALTLGLLLSRRSALGAATPAIESALAKLSQVMPASLQEQVQAVEENLILDVEPAESPPDSSVILTMSLAVHKQQRVRMTYRAWNGEETEREFDPYGLVYRDGRWYTTGYCHLRRAQRLFRLDRVLCIAMLDATFERPEGFDPLREVVRTIANIPDDWYVEVVLETSMARAQEKIPPVMGTLTESDEGVVLRCHSYDLAWMARFLVGLGYPLVVREPPELRDELRRLAAKIASYAERS